MIVEWFENNISILSDCISRVFYQILLDLRSDFLFLIEE